MTAGVGAQLPDIPGTRSSAPSRQVTGLVAKPRVIPFFWPRFTGSARHGGGDPRKGRYRPMDLSFSSRSRSAIRSN